MPAKGSSWVKEEQDKTSHGNPRWGHEEKEATATASFGAEPTHGQRKPSQKRANAIGWPGLNCPGTQTTRDLCCAICVLCLREHEGRTQNPDTRGKHVPGTDCTLYARLTICAR